MKKFAVVGFPKCGTMSLAEWLRKKYPGCQVTRPETIYKKYNPKHDWKDYECVTITRNPIDRIHSGQQYFTALQRLSVQEICEARWKNSDKYDGVGFADCINQSDYQEYIEKFESNYDVKITNYRFEDMIKDPDFPHINESAEKIQWTEQDDEYVRSKLEMRGIRYA